MFSHEKNANLKKLDALISEISSNLEAIEPIIKTCQENQEARKKKEQTGVLSVRFENCCLELLLSSWYIVLPEERMKFLIKFNRLITSTKHKLDMWPEDRFADSVENSLIAGLPLSKNGFETLLKDFIEIRADYSNNNYQEPKEPCIILAKPEHEKYLKVTK